MEDRRLDDDQLLDLLGEIIDAGDPVPEDAAATARAADLSTLDTELAELVFDSLLDERDVTVRSDPGSDVRSVTFSAGDRMIEVDLTDDELVGRVSPADQPSVAVEQAGPPVPADVDDLGRFRISVAPGPVRLRVGSATTPWITR